jgi:hypothetical protein
VIESLQYIPDIFAEVVTRVATALDQDVFFDFGRHSDVTKKLVQKNGAITEEKRTKYPLIWMVTDFEEKSSKDPVIYKELPNLRFIIATGTDKNYTMEQRRDKTFLPTLYPIYKEFLNQLSKTKVLGRPSTSQLDHSKFDRPYWGGQPDGGGSDANMFSDNVDAIEIRGLSLKVKTLKPDC